MFPSPNCNNPFESSVKRSSTNFSSDQNPGFKQDDHPPFLFDIPSPFFYEDELLLNQMFFQTQHMADNLADHRNHDDPTKKEATKRHTNAASKMDGKRVTDQQIPGGTVTRQNLGSTARRRRGKKDRHSKICTAQGVRDRRMRLSLQVARKFFDLQDMLGYDKASKTIEWLFTQSKKAIKELARNSHPQANYDSASGTKSESLVSDCEVVSGIDQENLNSDEKLSTAPPVEGMLSVCVNDERKPQKPACKSKLRESRDKARARARCRTMEKMMIRRLEGCGRGHKPNPSTENDDLQKLGSSTSQYEGVDQDSNSHDHERVNVSPYGAIFGFLEQQSPDSGTIEKLLGSTSTSTSSCPISEYLCCSSAVSGYTDPNSNFMGYSGNWDLLSNERMNFLHYAAAKNEVSLADNPTSIYSAPADFP